VRQPYSVSVLDQSAALAVLRRRSNLSDTLEKIKQERKRLYAGLCGMASLGVTVWPSDANFLLVRVPSAHKLRCRLRDEYSILVRDFSSAAGLKDCLRVTVGMPQENDSLLRSLTHLLEESCNE
jgi:histidinol-phosphate aminotransferase